MNPRLLIIGDIICDVYRTGVMRDKSRGADFPVMSTDHVQRFLGGAAAVASAAAKLGADVSLCGFIADDNSGKFIINECKQRGIDVSGVTHIGRHTTTKIYYRTTDGYVMFRSDVDRKDSPIDVQTLPLDSPDVILVSDYGKGAVGPETVSALRTRFPVTKIFVDPRWADWSRYAGANALFPNENEYAKTFRDDVVDIVVLKRGDNGASLGQTEFPARQRTVVDTNGAGDVFVAAVGIVVAGGANMADAIRFANSAAGLSVEIVGPVCPERESVEFDISHDGITPCDRVARHTAGKNTVLVNGCFDIIHEGHVRLLSAAARHGDVLVVAINSDNSVARAKGAGRPIIPESQRATVLSALASVDYVVVFDGDDPSQVIRHICPVCVMKGSEYAGKSLPEQGAIDECGTEVVYFDTNRRTSTTEIIESAKAS